MEIPVNSLREIPYTAESLFFNQNGEIVDLSNNKYLPDENGLVDMSPYWYNFGKIDVNLLRVYTVMGINIRPDQLRYVTVCKNGNDAKSKNSSFETNYYYEFKEPIMSETYGFYIIPYSTKYAINPSGVIIRRNVKGGVQLNPGERSGEGKYVTVRLEMDFRIKRFTETITRNQKHAIGLHRLMALAFIKYKDNPFFLDINHIDANPSNNQITNLEWTTRSENNIHAIDFGLNQTNHPVVVKDWLTGKIVRLRSQREADALFGKGRGAASFSDKVRYDDQTLYRGRYSIKLDDDKPWRYDTFEEVSSDSQYELLESYNVFTGERKIGLGKLELAEMINHDVNDKMISFIINCQKRRKGYLRLNKGYFFRTLYQPEFPKLFDFEIELFKKAETLNVDPRSPIAIFKNDQLFSFVFDRKDVKRILNIGQWTYDRMLRANESDDKQYYFDQEGNKWGFARVYQYSTGHEFSQRFKRYINLK